jgi:hypothetical protein
VGGLAGAWLLGEAIVIWRQVHASHRLPVPGALLGVTALFAGLALIADIAPASRTAVTLGAFGLDVAGLLNIWPQGFGGQVTQTAAAASAQTGGASA